MATTAFAIPQGPPVELALRPRLESWNKRDAPDQVALPEFVAHVRAHIDPLIVATKGPLAFGLEVGLPEDADPLWERDLDNYLFPIARELPARIVSVWGTKSRGPRSVVRLEPALRVASPNWQKFRVPRSPAGERMWKGAVRQAVAAATELPEGPVGLQLALTVGPTRNWAGMWKPSIDGLEALLGRTYPGKDWNPLDGRIVRLGLHRSVVTELKNDASMVVWARVADQTWPELRWLASMDSAGREAFFERHRASRRRVLSTPRRVGTESFDTQAQQTSGGNLSAVSYVEFQGDDDGYLSWVAANRGGYVINIQRTHNPNDSRLHRADCYTITGDTARGNTWTGDWVKVCSGDLRELDDWAIARAGAPITRCGACQPPRTLAGR